MAFHWKHGWIPISPEALSGHKSSSKGDRLTASRNKNAARDDAKRAREIDADNAKRGAISPQKMLTKYRGNDTGGTPPSTKVRERVKDGTPFTYNPGTGEVSRYRGAKPEPIAPGTEREVGVSSGRLGQAEVSGAAVDQAVEGLISAYHPQILRGAKITGQPGSNGKYLIGMTPASS